MTDGLDENVDPVEAEARTVAERQHELHVEWQRKPVQWLMGHPGTTQPPLDIEAYVRRIVREEIDLALGERESR